MSSEAWKSRGSLAALIVGFAVVAVSLGWGLQRLALGLERRNDGVVTVRGTAERNVKSDRAVWKLSVTNTGATAADALAGVDSGAQTVQEFFADHGVPASAVTLGSVSTFANKEYINGNPTGVVLSYEASR